MTRSDGPRTVPSVVVVLFVVSSGVLAPAAVVTAGAGGSAASVAGDPGVVPSSAPSPASGPDPDPDPGPGSNPEPGPAAASTVANATDPGGERGAHSAVDSSLDAVSDAPDAPAASDAAFELAPHRAGSSPAPYTADVVPAQPDIRWGGRAVAVDVHPTDADRAIVASESGGLFETTDGGSTWTHLDGHYPHRLSDVKYAPSTPSVIVLAADRDSRNLERGGRTVSGGGIWRSANGGRTWRKPATAEPPAGSGCGAAGTASAHSVAFEPGTTNVYVGTECGLAVSPDLGQSWTHELIDGQVRNAVAVVSPAQGTVDVCTDTVGHLRYRPATGTWDATAQTLPASCLRKAPHSLAASPADPDVLFAVVPVTAGAFKNDSVNTCRGPGSKRELFESDDGGQTWTDLNATGCKNYRSPFVATSPVTDDGAYAVFAGNGVQTYLQACRTDAAPDCSDDPDDWQNVIEDHADQTDVAFPSDDVCPAFMTNDGGVETTTSGAFCGVTWDMTGASGPGGFNALQLYTVAGRIFEQPAHADLYVGTQDNGQWAGERRGRAWTSGPGNEGGWMGLNRTAVAHGGEPIMLEAVDGRREVSDRNLTRIRAWRNPPALGSSSRAGVASDVGAGQAYYVDRGTYLQWNGTRGSRVFWLTTDTGATWRPRLNFSSASIRDTVVAGPAADPTVYVPVRGGLRKVTGVRASGPPTVTTVGSVDPAVHVRGEGTFDWNTVLAADPTDPDFVVLPDENTNTMVVSRDGGTTWTTDADLTRVVTANGRYRMDPPGKTTTQATEIDFDPGDPDRIFVGTEANGVVASFDGGETWGRIPGSRRIPAVSDFFFDDRTGGDGFRDVYVASYGRGLWKIDAVDTLQPLPAPDRFESGGGNDAPGSAPSVGPWVHTGHFRCPDAFFGLLGGRSSGDDCSEVLTDPDVDPTDFTSGAPVRAEETWDIGLPALSLDGPGDRDFYRIPAVPNPETHRDLGALATPECGTQTVSIGGTSRRVTTTGTLSVVVTPTGNSLTRTPVRLADGATPIRVYDARGRRLSVGTTVSSGAKLVHTIPCPHGNGYGDLVVSFGEGTAANSGAYEVDVRYRIDVNRPDDAAAVLDVLREVERIADNVGKYEALGERFTCRPGLPGGDPCVYELAHPIGGELGEEDFCERAICRQPWQLERVEERAFEMTVLGNENLRIELQRADPTSDGDVDPDGEVVAASRAVACLSGESFERLLVASGHGPTAQEVGVEALVAEMGEPCDGTRFGRQATSVASATTATTATSATTATTATSATTATTTTTQTRTPAGAAPVRHRLAVEALEPGLYQLVITGPPSAYWLEAFTPSRAAVEERDPASAPRAAFDATPVEAVTEAPVTFDATASVDDDGSIVSYAWRIGDDARPVTTRAATVTHAFPTPGTYPVRLTVTDDDGNTATATREVFVSPAPAGAARVSLEPARTTTGDCPAVSDNRLGGGGASDADPGEDGSSDPGSEAFEEEGLYCTVYDPATPGVDPGERIRYDVVVERANTGIGAAAFTVELTDGSAADLTAVSLGPDVRTGRAADVALPADAVSVSADGLADLLGDARGRTVLATITVEAADVAGGATGISLSGTELRDPRGDAYTVTAETGSSLGIGGDDAPPAPVTTVRFDPPDAVVERGTTAPVDLVVAGVDGGVGSYRLTVRVDGADRARIVGAEPRIGGGSRADLAADGSRVDLGAFAGDTVDTGTVRVVTLFVEGVAPGTAGLSVEVASLSDEAGEGYEVAATERGTVTVREEIRAPEVVVGRPAIDADGDGVYEDVNGDGDLTPGDATVLFNAVFEANAAVRDNPTLFDVNRDGSVTPGDATVLFNLAFDA